jgi:DNA-binding NarL/FixJ family response regulator
MARVLALVPDLLFGSRVQGALTAAGHDVELIAQESVLRARVKDAAAPAAAVLVVDLTNEDLHGATFVESLSGGQGDTGMRTLGLRTLGFYSHVDVHARERAEQAGFDLVVPRSRMAREAPELVNKLAQMAD